MAAARDNDSFETIGTRSSVALRFAAMAAQTHLVTDVATSRNGVETGCARGIGDEYRQIDFATTALAHALRGQRTRLARTPMTGTLASMLSTVQCPFTLIEAREETAFRIFTFIVRSANALFSVFAAIARLLNLLGTLTASASVTLGLAVVAAAIQNFGTSFTAALSIVGLTASQTISSTTAEAVLDRGHRRARRARARVALKGTRMRTVGTHFATQARFATRVRHLHGVVRGILHLATEAPRVGHAVVTVAALGAVPTLRNRDGDALLVGSSR